MKWGICDCGKWGEAPPEFDERVHFLKCPCGRAMYLHLGEHPSAAGYSKRNQVTVGLMPQTELP